MHSPITAHRVLGGLQLAHKKDTLAVLGVDEARGCLAGAVPIVVERPEAHGAVLAATQEEVLTAQGCHALDSPRVAREALQADLVEVKVGVLLAHADLVLPVCQPVPAQPVGTPWQLPLQCVVFAFAAGAPAAHPRDKAQWARALRLRVVRDLDAVPDQDAPEGPRVAVILGAAPALGVQLKAGAGHGGLHTGRAATARADALQIQPRQLPHQLVVRDDFLDDVTWMEAEVVLRLKKAEVAATTQPRAWQPQGTGQVLAVPL